MADAKDFLTERQARLAALEREQKTACETIQKAFELVVQGQMPQSRYHLICEPLEARLETAKTELVPLRTEIEALKSPHLTPKVILAETRAVSRQWPSWSVAQRRSFLESQDLELTVTKQNHLHLQLQYFPLSEELSNYPRTLRFSTQRQATFGECLVLAIDD